MRKVLINVLCNRWICWTSVFVIRRLDRRMILKCVCVKTLSDLTL